MTIVTPVETQDVTKGTFRLKGDLFSEDKLTQNMHQLMLASGVSYPTIQKYLKDTGTFDNFSGRVLYAILVEGMGYSPGELSEMRVGDLFAIEPENGAE